MITLRATLAAFLFALTLAGAAEESASPPRWIDASTLRIDGKGWPDTAHPFDRLPARVEHVVRGPVFSLGRDAAGLVIHFTTNTSSLRVRWNLRREKIAMSHFAATGVSGLDLYFKVKGEWRWAGVARPEKKSENESVFFANQPATAREFLLYLPLYNGIEKLDLGIDPDAQLGNAEPDNRPPIVFYGTSVVQGGCASRPGMAYPAIIGRRLARPTINLGFSGNGKAEPEMADLLATLTPAAFVIDTMGNLVPEEFGRLDPFIAKLRAQHPTTPILLVENVEYPDAILVRERREAYTAANQALRETFNHRAPRDRNLYLVPAKELMGADNEATVDGSHPTDLGFTRIADTLTPRLLQICGAPAR